MYDYDDEDENQQRRGRKSVGQGDAQPAVRKHLTVFNPIFKTYESKFYARALRDERQLQPHFHFMKNIRCPHSNRFHPADGVCSHFLLHGFNRLQKSPVNVGCWSSEARRLVLGTQSGEFTLWEGETFKFERLISTHTPHAVRAMTWSNHGQMLISGDQSGIIKYFNASITFVNSISDAHTSAVRGLSFSPSDTKFVSGSEDKTVKVWDWERAEAETIFEEHLRQPQPQPPPSSLLDVRCCAWHPYRALIVSGSKDNTVKLWDPRQKSSVHTIFSHKNTILSCGWSCSGHMLATGGRDQLVKLFDLRAMKDFSTLRGHCKEVCSLAWHPQHDTVLLTGGFNGTLIYWMAGYEGPHTVITNAHNYSVNMISWHPIGHMVASASNDGIVKFWGREPPGSKLEAEQGEWSDQLNTMYGPLDPSVVPSLVNSLGTASTSGPGTGIMKNDFNYTSKYNQNGVGSDSQRTGQFQADTRQHSGGTSGLGHRNRFASQQQQQQQQPPPPPSGFPPPPPGAAPNSGMRPNISQNRASSTQQQQAFYGPASAQDFRAESQSSSGRQDRRPPTNFDDRRGAFAGQKRGRDESQYSNNNGRGNNDIPSDNNARQRNRSRFS